MKAPTSGVIGASARRTMTTTSSYARLVPLLAAAAAQVSAAWAVLWQEDKAVVYATEDALVRHVVGSEDAEELVRLDGLKGLSAFQSVLYEWRGCFLCLLWERGQPEWLADSIGPLGYRVAWTGPYLFSVPVSGRPKKLFARTVLVHGGTSLHGRRVVVVAEKPEGRKVPVRIVAFDPATASTKEIVRERFVYGLWSVDVETGQAHAMAFDALADEKAPALSPDGRRLAFMRLFSPAQGELGPHDVFVRDLETGKETRVTNSGDCGYPAWSPDGSKLAYRKERGRGELWVTDFAKLSACVKPGHLMGVGMHGWVWAADGRSLVFIDNGDGEFIAARLGGGLKRLTRGARARPTYLFPSPSGRWVAYQDLTGLLRIIELPSPSDWDGPPVVIASP